MAAYCTKALSSLPNEAAYEKEKNGVTWPKQLNAPLEEVDPEIADISEHEKARQWKGLELIPSENFTSMSVMQAVGSVMTNKYSEGYPGARYYGGNEYIDMAETLCQKHALDAFQLDPAKWGDNLLINFCIPLSGSPANFHVYTALLKPHEKIMALDLPHGGHLSHGYQVCDKQKAILLADMAHISGLVAAGVIPSPFDFADVVTTTTHKSLREPRGAMIFFRKGVKEVNKQGKEVLYDYEDKINQAVFPGLQGGPHNHTITGLSVALKQVITRETTTWSRRLQTETNGFKIRNSVICAVMNSKETFWKNDPHRLGNDSFCGIDGSKVEKVLEAVHIAANKNTVPGDVSAMVPGGIRMGTPALTSRGFIDEDFVKVAEFFDAAVKIAVKIKAETSVAYIIYLRCFLTTNNPPFTTFSPIYVPGTKLKDFVTKLQSRASIQSEISKLRHNVEEYAKQFPTIGFEKETMKYKN
ncbi:Serine hydroxymethyltransferase, mitochondrial [Capsicum annuum]|uniref:glycine hydroxymethyltransferase n=1 Tax=Capsicum annuum TaxID=4072 RepID=A0A2G3A5D2_CAPAN|nr:Serine hydroxymethyltransferase, mitochondrial [Capsicum annuum]